MGEITKEIIKSQLEQLPEYAKKDIFGIYKTIVTLPPHQSETLSEALDFAVQDDFKNILSAINDYELKKAYKYTALFELDNNGVALNEILDNLAISESEELVNFKTSNFHSKKYGNILKINMRLSGSKLEGNQPILLETKYPVLVIFHEIQNKIFVEICVDNISPYLRNNESNFFLNRIDSIYNWLITHQLLTLTPLDLSTVINTMQESDNSEVHVSAQKMLLHTGSQATLDAANSQELILPILGELKELMLENEELFSASEEIQALLTEFIEEIEEQSDLPWISLTWDNRVKSNRLQIKFVFSSQTSERYTLLNYYSHRLGREGMRNATELLLNRYIEETTSTEVNEDESIAQ